MKTRTYAVTCARTVRQEVTVTVVASSAKEARDAVSAQHIPAQWPDGHYVNDRGHYALSIKARPL